MASQPTTPAAATARPRFTELSLPVAIGNLFIMNNYHVEYDVHVHGAQIDLIATAKGDPFAVPIYVEATIEYVTNDKYAKDSTKFLLINSKSPGSKMLCISSTGFTANVKERAKESGVEALTYEELFAKFEKFTPYMELALSDRDTLSLVSTYEEPLFNDSKGIGPAIKWLNYWKGFAPDEAKWLIVLGEYGTGKTSLTRVLQHRWLKEYHENPLSPIPVRIELRNFSRQFDAKGLLHYFLDTNNLSHVPVEFMVHLIKTGRVILLLDGYDEMAQFLNARERRACLSALADLASDGAKGILTSRPNYFTESEELNVFEALYKTLEQNKFHLSKIDRAFIADEKSVDSLVERYILNRFERSLQDLNPEQTKSLVKRKLEKDIEGQAIVLAMLERVFREEVGGSKQALSGKPVIISYLLELVDDLRADAGESNFTQLTEWQIYKLIVDKLMFRDMQRTPMNPLSRRSALQKLAIAISARDRNVADESVFVNIINEEFQSELKTLPNEERRSRRIELFEDLRSSATLTRASQSKADGWVFSHNSLREFLVAERYLDTLVRRSPVVANVPITTAMRGFAASIGDEDISLIWQAFAELWPQRASHYELGPYLNLLWESARRSPFGLVNQLREVTGETQSGELDFNNITIRDINLSSDVSEILKLNVSESSISDSDFSGINMTGSIFVKSVLDNVSFNDANLSGAKFDKALIFECEFSGTIVSGADFRGIDPDCSLIIRYEDDSIVSLIGRQALGYLKFHDAIVDDVDNYFVFKHHPKYSIVKKILEKISEQRNSQLRGLTQRGEARVDPPFARQFIDHLAASGWLSIDKNNLVSVSPAGRPEVHRMVTSEYMSDAVSDFLAEHI